MLIKEHDWMPDGRDDVANVELYLCDGWRVLAPGQLLYSRMRTSRLVHCHALHRHLN